MKKNRFVIGLLLVLFITGLAIGIWQFYYRPAQRPDFDKVGGTILVYEIDKGDDGQAADADLTAKMAGALERRLDFASVKALDNGRVEIRIPRRGDKHGEDVQRVKELLAKVGHLEFRILANSVDDKEAIKDARDMFDVQVKENPGLQNALKQLQEQGLPPPGPRVPGGKEPKVFEIVLPGKNKSQVTYSWVELGPQERRALNLDNAAETDGTRSKAWQEAKQFRGRATRLKDPTSTSGRHLLEGALFFSRECLDKNLPEEERKEKAVEYFVLARDPELDPKMAADLPVEKRRTPRIDGSRIRSAESAVGVNNIPAVHFSFAAEGGDLFGNLTRKNVPSGGPEESQVKRHLAIILDGQIMSAPTINSEIRDHGQITGKFTKKEVDNLANILRAGALPARLKPQPVSETTVEPKK